MSSSRDITEHPRAPSGVAAFMSAPTPPVGSQHSCQPTVKLHMLPLVWIFSSGKGLVRGRRGHRGQQLGFALPVPETSKLNMGEGGGAGPCWAQVHQAPYSWLLTAAPGWAQWLPACGGTLPLLHRDAGWLDQSWHLHPAGAILWGSTTSYMLACAAPAAAHAKTAAAQSRFGVYGARRATDEGKSMRRRTACCNGCTSQRPAIVAKSRPSCTSTKPAREAKSIGDKIKLEPTAATGCVHGSTPMVWYGKVEEQEVCQ